MIIRNTINSIENLLLDKIIEIQKLFPEQSNFIYSKENIIAKYLNIKIVELNSGHGYYSKDLNSIFINPNINSKKRVNFTFFHEVSHYLIETDDNILSIIGEINRGQSSNFDLIIEPLCDFGASQFLIPQKSLRKMISNQGFSIRLIKVCDEEFSASLPAIARQLSNSANHKCTILIVKRNYSNSFENELIIEYSYTSKSNKYRPKNNTIISNEHLINKVNINNPYITGRDYIPYGSTGNKKHVCNCEILYIKTEFLFCLTWNFLLIIINNYLYSNFSI